MNQHVITVDGAELRADEAITALPAQAWRARSAADAAKGERLYDWARTPVRGVNWPTTVYIGLYALAALAGAVVWLVVRVCEGLGERINEWILERLDGLTRADVRQIKGAITYLTGPSIRSGSSERRWSW
ncbi:hypothetical protein [Rhodococcus tibetensis]|uniref:Uncharacterized protein n=1 Tax=Rhodococcus tibetensis TaxID=2965064 RepID=A0ABT1QGF9_9NOCA|nr:hypothetical protein [Rhodococcus sp. FXJ9.536]MCQ4121356.1 hypothetical protein [Rhodococcus sp. FXJ9.536]